MPFPWRRNPFQVAAGPRQRSSSDSHIPSSVEDLSLRTRRLDVGGRGIIGSELQWDGYGAYRDIPEFQRRPDNQYNRQSDGPLVFSKMGSALAEHELYFYGKPGESAEQYVRRFEDAADISGWDDRQQVRCFVLGWKGLAKTWWLCQKPQLIRFAEESSSRRGMDALTFSILKDAFLRRFAVPHRIHLAKHQLYVIRQNPREDVSSYAGQVQELGDAAFPEMEHKLRQENLIYPFIEGLFDDQIRTNMLSSKPLTFEAAFESALGFENSLKVARRSGMHRGGRTALHAESAVVGRVFEKGYHSRRGDRGQGGHNQGNQFPGNQYHRQEWKRTHRKAGSVWTEDGRPICRACGQAGHYAKECPQKFQDSRGNAQQATRNWRETQQSYSRPREMRTTVQNGRDAEGAWAYQRGHTQAQGRQTHQTNAVTVDRRNAEYDELRMLLTAQSEQIKQLRAKIDDPYGIGTHQESNCIVAISHDQSKLKSLSPRSKMEQRSVGIQTEHNPNQICDSCSEGKTDEESVDTNTNGGRPVRKVKRRKCCGKEARDSHHCARKNGQEECLGQGLISHEEDWAANEGTGRSGQFRTSNRNCTPKKNAWWAMALLTVLLTFLMSPAVGADQFHICKPPRGGIPLSPPGQTECPDFSRIPDKEEKGLYTVWWPLAPPTSKLKQCFLRNQSLCTTKTWWPAESNVEYTVEETSVSKEECVRLWNTKRWGSTPLVEITSGIYSTNETLKKDPTVCTSITNAIIQSGTIGITRNGIIYSSLSSMDGCEAKDGFCQTSTSAMFWDPDQLKKPKCSHGSDSFAQDGRKKGRLIELSNFPHIFHIVEGPLASCLPSGAWLTAEDIVIEFFSNATLQLKPSTILDSELIRRLGFIQQSICELHQWQQFLMSHLTQIDPTLGVRLLLLRNDVQAIWRGKELIASSCQTVEVNEHDIQYDHRIGTVCFYFTPVHIKGIWMFANFLGELLEGSPIIPCSMAPDKSQAMNFGDQSGIFNSEIPGRFLNKSLPPLEMDYALTDLADDLHSPLVNLPRWISGYQTVPQATTIASVERNDRLRASRIKEAYLTKPAIAKFDRLVEIPAFPSFSIYDVLHLLVNQATQAIVNASVILLAVTKIICRCCCCCTCGRWFCKGACRRRRRSSSRFRQRRGTVERTEIRRDRSLSRRAPIMVVGPTRSLGNVPLITCSVRGYNMDTLMDSGASLSIINYETLKRAPRLPVKATPLQCKVLSANGKPMPITHGIMIPIQIGPWVVEHFCGIIRSGLHDLILGTDFLKNAGIKEMKYDVDSNRVSLDGVLLSTQASNRPTPTARLVETVDVPPRSYLRFPAKVDQCLSTQQVVFEPDAILCASTELLLTPTLNILKKSHLVVEAMNLSNQPVRLYKGSKLGTISIPIEIAQRNCIEQNGVTNTNAQVSTVGIEGMAKKTNVVSQTGFLNPQELDKAIRTPTINDQQCKEVRDLLLCNSDVFSAHDFDLGNCRVVTHQIDTQNHAPIRLKPYRLPFAQREVLEKQVKGLMQAGIIRPSTSPWAFPCLLVRKKEQGEWRLVIDYRKLNAIMKIDQYRIPHIDDILYSLSKAQYFSSIDLSSGYHQLFVDEKDREKTAFWANGLYEFAKMPMGISNAGATYQRAMDLILSSMLWKNVFCYLDDILIASEEYQDHLLHIQQVFDSLRKHNLKIKLRKCHFFREELPFLGYVVTKGGLCPDPAKIERVQAYPKPTSVPELRTFLGLVSYYRRYIKHFAEIAGSLHDLLKKGTKFVWSSVHDVSFRKLKDLLTTAPVLAYPQFGKPFIIHSDASNKGLGAVLSQIGEDGYEHPIAYASRTLQKAERNYSATEKEGLAVVYALKTFRPFVYMQKTALYTDHNALRYLMSTSSPNGRIARWALAVQEYQPYLEIKYRPGKSNANADALARAFPQPDSNQSSDKSQKSDGAQYHMVSAIEAEEQEPLEQDSRFPTAEKLMKAQREDTWLMNIITYIERGISPDDPKEAWCTQKASERYTLEDGLLLYQPDKQTMRAALAIPKSMVCEVLALLHDSPFTGHLGMDKTYERCKGRFQWPSMYRDIRDYCRYCIGCTTRKRPKKYFHAKLKPINVNEPWELVGCDIMGPMKQTENGYRFLVVFSDYMTGYTEAFPVPETSASTIAHIFVEEIVCRYGAPQALRTDQGPQFCSQLTKEILEICGTEHKATPPYAPWCNGKVERTNAVLADIISQYTNGVDWDKYVRYAVFAYNTAVQASTRQTPFFLLFGRDANLPIDRVFEYRKKTYEQDPSLPDTIMEKFSTAYVKAREQIDIAQARQKHAYDKNAQDVSLKLGDLVHVLDPTAQRGAKGKFAHRWKWIYRIIRVELPDLIVQRVSHPREAPRRIHVNNVKLYSSTPKESLVQEGDKADRGHACSDSESTGSVEY